MACVCEAAIGRQARVCVMVPVKWKLCQRHFTHFKAPASQSYPRVKCSNIQRKYGSHTVDCRVCLVPYGPFHRHGRMQAVPHPSARQGREEHTWLFCSRCSILFCCPSSPARDAAANTLKPASMVSLDAAGACGLCWGAAGTCSVAWAPAPAAAAEGGGAGDATGAMAAADTAAGA